VVYDLVRFLFKDYGTLLITVVLLVTVWRTLNTLEILYLYGQRHSYLRCLCSKRHSKEFVDYQIKDVSL
jgi:hypothetical protein